VYECGVDLPAEIMPASCHGVTVHERVLPPWPERGEALPHPELKDVEGRVEGERGEHVGIACSGGGGSDEEGLDVAQVAVEGGEDGGAEGEAFPSGEADGDGEEGLAHGGLGVAREDEAGEPEGEEGGVLMLGGGSMVMGEEVLDPGGVVRLLAGAAIESEAHPIEGRLVGAPLGSERGRDGGAVGGESSEEGDVLEGDGGLAPGEGEGVGAGAPEGGEVEEGGGVAAEAVGGGEDGVVDAEAAPEVGVDGAELGDPEVPVAGRAEPSAEGEAGLGGGGSLERGRRAEGMRRGRAAACVLRGENVSQVAPVIPIHVEGELMD
jgi:hypothetical protein